MDLSMFTTMQGRIGRQSWWLGLIVLSVIEWLVIFVIGMLFGTPEQMEPGTVGASYNLGVVGGTIAVIVMIPFIWAGLCVSAKRWHDRGKSAWWILIGLVPIIGGLWTLIECGFLRGTEGPNAYGPDPLGAN